MMLHAAALFTIAMGLWLVLTQSWNRPVDIGAAALVALVVVAVSWRMMRGVWGFGGAFQQAIFAVSRLGARLHGALTTIRAAIAADVTLQPALVRLKSRQAETAASRAAFSNAICATPGSVVVDVDDEGLLVHVIDENRVNASEFSAIEARAMRAFGRIEAR